MKNLCFLDFETRSLAKIKDVGASRYCLDPSTEILCLAYAFGNSEPKLWVKDQKPPADLMNHIEQGGLISGWNSLSFERAVFDYVAGPRLGWAVPKDEQYYDTMHDALALGLPAELEQCALAVGAVEQKDKEGKKLIQKLCRPIANGKNKGKFRSRQAFPEDFAKLYMYCKQDVRTERWIHQWLPRHVTGAEREVQLLTAKMNKRGVPIDVDTVENIVYVLDLYLSELNDRCVELTTFTATQRDALKFWLEDRGLTLPNMQNATLEAEVSKIEDPIVKEVVDIRIKVNRTSVAKFRKILAQQWEGIIRDNLIYHKATTGRYAGAGVQLQNLPRHSILWRDYAISLFNDHDLEAIKLWGEPIDVAVALIRSMVCTPEGYIFYDSDLSKVEAIGTAWVAKEENILEAHRQGLDNYKVAASGMYNVDYADVNKDQRQLGKVAELSGGFGGGAPAIMRGAKQAGLEISEERAEEIKVAFRRARKKLVSCWYSFGRAALKAVRNPRTTVPVEHNKIFQFRCEGHFLYMSLPSGRLLAFPYPEIRKQKFKGRVNEVVSAMWVNSTTKQWERRAVIGSNFFQSAVQGLCRDILMQAHLRIEDDGWPMYMSVHDESVSMVKDTPDYTMERYNHLMTVPLDWMVGFPIRSDGWKGRRYKKD